MFLSLFGSVWDGLNSLVNFIHTVDFFCPSCYFFVLPLPLGFCMFNDFHNYCCLQNYSGEGVVVNLIEMCLVRCSKAFSRWLRDTSFYGGLSIMDLLFAVLLIGLLNSHCNTL